MSKKIKYKILIVDDEESSLFYLEDILTNYGFEVLTCISGESALEVISWFKPDLILLYIKILSLDGIEVLEILKEIKSTSKIPVIVITDAVENENINFLFIKGASDYIKKPVSEIKLIEKINNILNKQ